MIQMFQRYEGSPINDVVEGIVFCGFPISIPIGNV